MAQQLEATRHATRAVCHKCSVRLFVYSTDDEGQHYCPACTHRMNGVPLCLGCGTPIRRGRCEGTWLHVDASSKKRKHAATPENLNAAYLPPGTYPPATVMDHGAEQEN